MENTTTRNKTSVNNIQRISYLLGKHLSLPTNSLKLKIILNDSRLLNYYAEMIKLDEERVFENFKYLGYLTNPEGAKQLDTAMEEATTKPSDRVKELNMPFPDGISATEQIRKENEMYGIDYSEVKLLVPLVPEAEEKIEEDFMELGG